ncbi:MCF2L family protein [Megaselia abdita]
MNGSSSLEMQIDNFLEHFKRSASKAMDGDWALSSSCSSQRSRHNSTSVDPDYSDNDVEAAIAQSKAIVMSSSRQQLQHQQLQMLQSQQQSQSSSISSCASVQTVMLHATTTTTMQTSTTTTVSRNSLLQPNSMVNSTYSGTSGHEILNIADVADLLHPQHAIITGGKSSDGCPLIIFPDNNNFQALDEMDYRKLIVYLYSVPSMQDADLGFHLIIDRRKDKWAAVKAVLLKISVFFPGIVHVVYVLRPSGFFQKAISEVSSKFFKEDFRFRLVVCSSVEELHEHIDKSQLALDMGGSLTYSHHEWIQQRISLEKFSTLTHQVSTELDIFIQVIHDTEFPNSVESTEKLIIEQGIEYDRLKEEILAAAKHGELLLENMRSNEESKEFSERTGHVSSIESNIHNPSAVQSPLHHQLHDKLIKQCKNVEHFDDDCWVYRRLLVQLEETERRFDEFWKTHKNRLNQCLHLRRFEQDFRELQSNFDNHLKVVTEMTEIGDSVLRVDVLIDETKDFQDICRMDIERAGEVITAGQDLIGFSGAYPCDVVQPKCDELTRVCDILTDRLGKRFDILTKNRDLMERVEKANGWCTAGIELLGSQHIEKCSSSIEIAELNLKKVQEFLQLGNEFKISSPKEFRNVFIESTTPETKALVSQVLQRIDDVSLMCDKRIATLKKLTIKPPPKPVQTVIPEPAVPLQPPIGAPHLRRRNKTDVISDLRPRSMDGVVDSGISLNGDISSSPDCDLMQNQQDIETRRLKRGHVLTELLETERIYVSEMSSILKGYRDQMQSEELVHLVPASLQGKEDVLFGNLHELYKFHSEVFLKDLEKCISTTELVALCFVQRRDTFYRLYSFYCQNIPRSERLRETLVDTHLFLQECQKRLGHKLPLAAYLLKPVQRITKYQLLLKDLLRFSDNSSCTKELQKALDCMLIVLKCVNDSMHQIAITGFPNDLSQQGELLLQDSFQVLTEAKKDIRLRLKPQQRHIFLYQKSMLFCKQTSKTGHNKSTYQYKNFLKMSQVGLTESVRGDQKRFELWLQGRQEVYTLQAATVEIKNKWVAEIKRVLFNQLEELKGEKIKQYGQNCRHLKQMTSWDPANTIISLPQRNISCDTSSESNRNSNGSSTDDHGPPHTPGVNSLSSSNNDGSHDACGWSSDYSNSDDELSMIEENNTPIPIPKAGLQRHIWDNQIKNHRVARVGIKIE